MSLRHGEEAGSISVFVDVRHNRGTADAAAGDSVTLLGHTVTLLERNGDEVHVRVTDADGTVLPYPPDDA